MADGRALCQAPRMFNALVVDKDGDGSVAAHITELDEAQLPEGDTTIAVADLQLDRLR